MDYKDINWTKDGHISKQMDKTEKKKEPKQYNQLDLFNAPLLITSNAHDMTFKSC